MLEDLKILNGELSLKYDSLNTIYTVNINEEVNALELEYRLAENVKISIIGNENLHIGLNEVVLTVYKEDLSESYYLYVYKEKEAMAISSNNLSQSLNIEKEELWEYAVPVISSICFLVILFTFCLLFSKKKKKSIK